MCLEYSGGLTYRDGCRKKQMEQPLIVCKIRPLGKNGEAGDPRKCKNYYFVKFGWHRIWTLSCPEHGDDDNLDMLEEYEAESNSDVITELDLNLIDTQNSQSSQSFSLEHGNEPHSNLYKKASKILRTPRPHKSHARDTSTTTTSSSQSSSTFQNISINDWFGTWPASGPKAPETNSSRRKEKSHRRNSLSSIIPMSSKNSMRNLVPALSRTSKDSPRSDVPEKTDNEATPRPNVHARFATQLPPNQFKDRGKANRPRLHTRNKSAQVLGVEDPVVEGISRELAILSGLGISC